MTTNPNQLELAREWAQLVGPGAASNIGRAAAEVITALPDEWIDADKLREVIEGWRTTTNQTMHRVDKTYESAAADIEALLPAPKPRTLAHMTRDERKACQWMQAYFTETEYWHVITAVAGEKSWLLRQEDGSSFEVPNSQIIPLPDLPRMVWPEVEATEETPEVEEGIYGQALWDMFKKAIRDEKEYHIDAQDYEGVKRWRDAERALGTAMATNPPKETPDLPEPEDVKPDPQPGEAWLIEYEGKRYEAVYWYSPLYAHWSFVVNREGLKTVESPEATPVSRLVPEKGGVS